MATTAHAGIAQLARRFPLVPRPRPALPPLPQQLAEIAALARTPPDHPDADARIATAHNKAALIASNCGDPDLARRLCWQHHHNYATRRPWTARDARYALEPLVNLARLHIRDDQPDLAIQILESLLTATGQHDVADIDGHPVDLGPTITPDDRDAVRRWIWTVTLADGIRALTRVGRWDDALAHADRHHGVGATLLDGRQVAVLTYASRGDHTTARSLLASSVRAGQWQDAVAHILGLLICCGTKPPVQPRLNLRTSLVALREDACVPEAFGIEVQLAILELDDGAARSAIRRELVRQATDTVDAALALTILTHPARRQLPPSLLHRLAAIDDQARRLNRAGHVPGALADALLGRLPTAHGHDCARS